MRAIIIASHPVPRLLDSRHLLAESGRIMLSATQAAGNCQIARRVRKRVVKLYPVPTSRLKSVGPPLRYPKNCSAKPNAAKTDVNAAKEDYLTLVT
jgi:hypothetical protein